MRGGFYNKGNKYYMNNNKGQHSLRGKKEALDMAWQCPSHEERTAPARGSVLGPPWEVEQGQAAWHMEENHRGGDEGGWQDLERTPLAGPGPDCLEAACWRLMLLQEPRGLSE